MLTKTHALIIRTPEGIAFPLLLASPVSRFLAWIIDCVCIMVIIQCIQIPIFLISRLSMDLGISLFLLLYFTISIGYGMVLEWFWRGQTLGKWLLRLRVTDQQGMRLRLNQIVMRNLLRFVDSLPLFYLAGGIACVLSPRAQRLGDLAANTIVIRNPEILEPDLEQLLAGKYNSLVSHPHLTARLRQRVTAEDARLALDALLRRNELDDIERVKLFAELAGHFRQITPFPAEATEGLTDEQYVRNVAEILFRDTPDNKKNRTASAAS
ncbi:MAG: RDD family protein [Verrucomicrobiae bacterium]|nr:RDD family protein [Verrucomicrobiae bacterium]